MRLRDMFRRKSSDPCAGAATVNFGWRVPAARSARRSPVVLRIEPLEDRWLPSAAPAPTFVASVVQGVLKYNADAAQLQNYSAELSDPSQARLVAQEILATPENRQLEVDRLYTRILGRSASATERTIWVNALAQGSSLEQLTAALLGSNEFYARVGNRPDSWL